MSHLDPKRDREGRKWETGSAKRKRQAERVVSS